MEETQGIIAMPITTVPYVTEPPKLQLPKGAFADQLPKDAFAENEIYVECSQEELEYYRNFAISRVDFCTHLIDFRSFTFGWLDLRLMNAFRIKDDFRLSYMKEVEKRGLYPGNMDNIHIGAMSDDNSRDIFLSFNYEDNGLDIDDIREIAESNGYKILIDSELNERLGEYNAFYDRQSNELKELLTI